MKKNDDLMNYRETMGIDEFKCDLILVLVGAIMTLPLLLACTIAEWLSSLY